ncbi:MAG: cyclic nucleotide-binding domain-containing protein [Bdellovibrionota bacterium]
MSNSQSDRKTFLLVSSESARLDAWTELVRSSIHNATIYSAMDGPSSLDKIANAVPHVVMLNFNVAKMTGTRVLDAMLSNDRLANVAIVIDENLPSKEAYLDEIVSGRIQFVGEDPSNTDRLSCIQRALDFAFQGARSEFKLRFFPEGHVLLSEGEKAEFVYFVKKGTLRAYRDVEDREVHLGTIVEGEFVGEMSYVTDTPRAASVKTVTACELIEVPIGLFKIVLFRRPSWSKALMVTLSKRLALANSSKS